MNDYGATSADAAYRTNKRNVLLNLTAAMYQHAASAALSAKTYRTLAFQPPQLRHLTLLRRPNTNADQPPWSGLIISSQPSDSVTLSSFVGTDSPLLGRKQTFSMASK